jgi:hypothetical protein
MKIYFETLKWCGLRCKTEKKIVMHFLIWLKIRKLGFIVKITGSPFYQYLYTAVLFVVKT